MLASRSTFFACEQRLGHGSRSVPTVAIVGASYTAGVGPDNPALAWSAVLVRELHWNAAIYGVPGAGYVRRGARRMGPVRHLLSAERLRSLHPSLVIVQAGFNDNRVPPRLERQRVRRTIGMIRAEVPRARIALITVFTAPSRSVPRRFYRTDRAIVAAGKAADRHVIIMDPLLGRWKFQHAKHGHSLHPTAAGDVWIARKAAEILRGHGVFPAAPNLLPPVICDVAVIGGQSHAAGL